MKKIIVSGEVPYIKYGIALTKVIRKKFSTSTEVLVDNPDSLVVVEEKLGYGEKYIFKEKVYNRAELELFLSEKFDKVILLKNYSHSEIEILLSDKKGLSIVDKNRQAKKQELEREKALRVTEERERKLSNMLSWKKVIKEVFDIAKSVLKTDVGNIKNYEVWRDSFYRIEGIFNEE